MDVKSFLHDGVCDVRFWRWVLMLPAILVLNDIVRTWDGGGPFSGSPGSVWEFLYVVGLVLAFFGAAVVGAVDLIANTISLRQGHLRLSVMMFRSAIDVFVVASAVFVVVLGMT